MNLRMLSLVPYQKSYLMPGLYAYSSHGVPGLELVGLGSRGRVLKEKVIYLSRENSLRFPLKRYVISIEGHEGKGRCGKDSLKNLELAIVLIFWTMTGNLCLHHPENCLVTGQIGLDGKIRPPDVDRSFWRGLNEIMRLNSRNLTVIGPGPFCESYDFINCLEVKELLETLVLKSPTGAFN